MKNDLLIIGEITSALPLLDLLLASSQSKKTQPEDMTVPPFLSLGLKGELNLERRGVLLELSNQIT